MQKIIFLHFFLFLLSPIYLIAQADLPVYFKGAIKENKIALQRNIVKNTITKNLSLPLTEYTEENWMDAFWGMELLHYKSPWTDGRINMAFDDIEIRSAGFQRAVLELAYTIHPDRYVKQVKSLLNKTADAKIFAMCAEYLLLQKNQSFTGTHLINKKTQLVRSERDEAILSQIFARIHKPHHQKNNLPIKEIMRPDFLKGYTILYSFQRKNRDYPGLALVRDSAANFTTDENGLVFSVPQLARSINNLPGYLTNGNTPQGIFRMYGFDTSKTTFIGPTTNIQLTMPYETSLRHFFNDSTITDSIWTEEWYKKLLPPNLKNSQPLFESFYAGKAGRSEIIAHGTTVNPEYYTGEPYYPQTPTMGCLCTKEIWSDVDGQRLVSDQQKLAAALQRAGGPNGYCVVIEIDDQQQPVSLSEILSLLKTISTK